MSTTPPTLPPKLATALIVIFLGIFLVVQCPALVRLWQEHGASVRQMEQVERDWRVARGMNSRVEPLLIDLIRLGGTDATAAAIAAKYGLRVTPPPGATR